MSEVVGSDRRAEKKRQVRRSSEERALIVRDSYEFGVMQTAKLHGVTRSLIYYWRKLAKSLAAQKEPCEEAIAFASVQVEVLPALGKDVPVSEDEHQPSPCGCLREIELKFGVIRLQLPKDMAVERIAGLVLALEAGR
ncbi:hypothetical protein ACQU0X_30015 [Pseudovibrio ascidiaceicola]|uniref:hypothetical protein n=1 Tax=Pseudovibrio ascidiaceicola TaxID=285279 RepID=UPI003D364055